MTNHTRPQLPWEATTYYIRALFDQLYGTVDRIYLAQVMDQVDARVSMVVHVQVELPLRHTVLVHGTG